MSGNLLYAINVLVYKNKSCKLSNTEAIQMDYEGTLVTYIFENSFFKVVFPMRDYFEKLYCSKDIYEVFIPEKMNFKNYVCVCT
jgi:hypothetical protein